MALFEDGAASSSTSGTPDFQSQVASGLGYAVDNAAVAATGQSVMDSLSDVFTKAVPIIGRSIINSFAHTATDVANWLGAGIQYDTLEQELSNADSSGELLSYYQQRAGVLDATALAVGSLAPGMVALKMLKVVQAGNLGYISKATNILAGPRKALIEKGIAEIQLENASLFGAVNADKYKAIALGFGEQALQAAAWETATLATMYTNPTINKADLGTIVLHVATGAALGGTLGGIFDAIGIHRQFKQAGLFKEAKEKFAEVTTRYGKGNINEGDRVVDLIDSVFAIPESAGAEGLKGSAATKYTATRNAAINDAHLILRKIGPEDDPEVTRSLLDMIVKGRELGLINKEDMYLQLGRAAKVQRIGEINGIPDAQFFYANEFATGKGAGLADIFSPTPTVGPTVSRTYKASYPGALDKLTFGRFDDAVEWEGRKVAKWASPEEAFDRGGLDVFVDSKLIPHINPDSSRLQQVARKGENRILTAAEEKTLRETGKLPVGKDSLTGASVIVNTITGGVRESALPVVGDLASGKDIVLSSVTRNGKLEEGLRVGDRTFVQSVDSGFTPDAVSALEANSRYVWANKRGIKKGDTIDSGDLPMLEQLYREMSAPDRMITKADSVKIRTADGELLNLPGDPAFVAERILAKKRELVEQLTGGLDGLGNKKILLEDPIQPMTPAAAEAHFSGEAQRLYNEVNKIPPLDEVAQKINAPLKWIEDGMPDPNFSYAELRTGGFAGSDNLKGVTIDPAQHTRLNHVRVSYDIAQATELDGMVVRGQLDAQQRIKIAQEQAHAAVANFMGEGWDKFVVRGTAVEANQLGAAPGLLSFANADAKTLAANSQFTGQQTTLFIQARQQVAQDHLASSYAAVLGSETASAELGTLTFIGRKSTRRYAFLPDGIAAKNKLPANTVVLENALVKDADGNITDWNQKFLPPGYKAGDELRPFYSIKSAETAEFLRAHQRVNDERLLHNNNWLSAQGIYKEIAPGALYFPPIDTNTHKFVAFVREKQGRGMGSSSVAAIAARSAEDLKAKVAQLDDTFEVFYKDSIKKNHEVIGDYDYNMNLVQNTVDDTLKKKGILSDIAPTVRGETVLKEYVDWHMRQETRLVRNHVELANAQLFAELKAQGARFTDVETSRVGYVPSVFRSSVSNPYDSYIHTSLGISEKSTYRLWQDANEKAEQYFSTAFEIARKTFGAASRGIIDYEKAVKITESYGLGNPYAKAVDAMTEYGLMNNLPPQKYLQGVVAQMHSIISATAIRLDVFQNLINIVSTPVMLLSQAAAVNGRRTQALADATEVLVPGTATKMPSSLKASYTAVSNFFDADARAAYTPIYKEYGWIRDRGSDYISMLNDMSILSKGGKLAEIKEGMARATDKASALIGSNWSEEFVRFVAADTGRQLYEAQGMVGYELWSSVNTFVNRVHGNYIASQRPIAFQGPLGQAMSLFQTYQFNLMQQVFKHIENGEAKSLAILTGLQGTLFGLQGLPGFSAVNTHIVGNAKGNSNHQDFYSGVPTLLGKDMGNWFLYGSVSNFLGAGLYTRGDINPRQITILPVNPLDFPAVSSSIRFISNLANTVSKMKDGGNLLTSLLNGIEHNGISRPLTGLAQQAQGYSTTGEGKLIAASNDWMSISSASRILGARPLDEAITMDAMFRMTAYRAKDTERLTQLGEAVKTHLYENKVPPPGVTEDFAAKYAASGGRIENFGKRMVQWTKDANISTANAVYNNLKNPLNYNMMTIMGGERLQDFSSGSGSTELPDVEK